MRKPRTTFHHSQTLPSTPQGEYNGLEKLYKRIIRNKLRKTTPLKSGQVLSNLKYYGKYTKKIYSRI